jgi:glycerophosphoryl diester phosphodiesterase
METIKIESENVKMIAHRGLSGLERENTMAAFIAAGNRSYYGIECDIHKTLDGQFVVIHDDNTKRVSPVDNLISETNYEDLLAINLYDVNSQIPSAHLKIPTLSQYLDSCKKYDKVCFIEFKNLFEEEDILKVVEIVEAKQYTHKVVYISFILENLICLRKHQKQAIIQYLVGEMTPKTLLALRKYRFGLDINTSNLTKDIVDEVHKYHLEVNVWTVDNPIEALMLVSWGVDYITTNILE